jgi:predicted RNA binding protein YcfA (HicA-like mRNA interferase family)
MGRLTPVTHRELVARLQRLGFTGPYAGGKHLIMVRGQLRLVIPNIHGSEIGPDLLARIPRQAEISREQWDAPQL